MENRNNFILLKDVKKNEKFDSFQNLSLSNTTIANCFLYLFSVSSYKNNLVGGMLTKLSEKKCKNSGFSVMRERGRIERGGEKRHICAQFHDMK